MDDMIEEILVGERDDGIAAAAIGGHRLEDYVAIRGEDTVPIGAICRARITSVSSNLELAFLDVGEGCVATLERRAAKNLTPGCSLMVQITAAARDGKPARASRRIAHEGVGVVLLPGAENVAMSTRLVRDAETDAVRRRVAASLPQGFGAVLRAGVVMPRWRDALSDEVAMLLARHRRVEATYSIASAPAVIDVEPRARRAALPLLARSPGATIVASEVQSKVVGRLPGWIVTSAGMSENVFDRADIDTSLAEAERSRVELRPDGSLQIERSAAFTAIDVDSGNATSTQANRAAAIEIARQLRLRDCIGLVLVDFVRDRKPALTELETILRREISIDRRDVEILGWTRGGLLELRRGGVAAA
jgi:ribonuclease G